MVGGGEGIVYTLAWGIYITSSSTLIFGPEPNTRKQTLSTLKRVQMGTDTQILYLEGTGIRSTEQDHSTLQ
jgi:hypothetical protein